MGRHLPVFGSASVLVLLACFTGGCATSSPVPPDLVYGYAGGDFVTEFRAPTKDVAETTTQVMTLMGLTDQSVRSDEDRGFVRARAGRGELVTMRLRRLDGGLTRATIRYGVFGSQEKSVEMAEQIRTRLKARAVSTEPTTGGG